MSVSINVHNHNEKQLVHNLAYMNTPCLLVHHTGRIIGCNSEFLTVSSYNVEQLIGCNVYKDILMEFEGVDQLQEYARQGKRNRIEWKGEDHQRVSQIQPYFIPYEQNMACYVYLKFLEITDIEELQSFFTEQLFTYSHLALLLLDQQGKVLHMTKAVIELIGEGIQDYVGKNIIEYFDTKPFNQRLLQKSLLRETHTHNKVIAWHNGQGEKEIILDSFPIYDHERNWIGLSVFIKDVTNVRLLEDQMRRKDRLAMIGQIAAGTAHEIRNPLTSIKGFLQVLKKTLEDHSFTREVHYTEIMLEEIERINQLLGEFLLLSRSKETKHEMISLTKLMKQFLPLMSNEAQLKGIDIEHQEIDGLPQVIGNRDLLKQVFLNICKNAIEAINGAGKIRISYQLHPEQNMLSINFEDNGPGIPSYVLDKIFDPFFTTKEEGTGLGLSVCHRIIHDMGGEIGVVSTEEFTVFRVLIPFTEA